MTGTSKNSEITNKNPEWKHSWGTGSGLLGHREMIIRAQGADSWGTGS